MTTILTTKEVAHWLGLSPETVWALCRRNALPYVKVGGRYRFVKEDLTQWMKEEAGCTFTS